MIESSLKHLLTKTKTVVHDTLPEEIKQLVENGIKEVKESGIETNAISLNSLAPDFTLKNQNNIPVTLYNLLNESNVMLIWYRGNWCPYCNVALNYYQQHLADLKKNNIKLIGLSPEVPEQLLATSMKHSLNFDLVSDVNNAVARAYGLVYKMPEYISSLMNSFINLEQHNGNANNELPLTATILVNQSRKVIYRHIETDYKFRAEPKEVMESLLA